INNDGKVSFEEFSLYWHKKVLKLTDHAVVRKVSVLSDTSTGERERRENSLSSNKSPNGSRKGSTAAPPTAPAYVKK
ncbi:hypothetical protein SARC_13343, partial [Sphaeroforma arctica JP610]